MTDPLLKKWLLANGNGEGGKFTEDQIDSMGPEFPYYPPTKKFMETFLHDSGCSNVHLEITGTNSFSAKLKKEFGEPLQLLDKSFSPDISGIYEKGGEKKIIIVEVKPIEMTIRDIYQTLTYFELVNAEIGILITPKKIPVRMKNYLTKNPELFSMCGRKHRIFIGTISLEEEKFLPEDWYPAQPTF